MRGIVIKSHGLLGIVSASQYNNGEKALLFLSSKALNNIIPEGTTKIDINQAIITPKAMSRPNS